MSIIREFTLYLHAGITTPEVIHANQYSQGETWIFKLLQDDGSVYVPSTGALIGVKADGHAIAGLTGTVLGDGRVSITTTQQLTAAAGDATCELTIDGGTNGSANFVIRVEKKPTDDAILSESDLSIIQEGLNSVTPAAINESVSNYLEENLTDPPIDPTLSISNAAADAKVTGDKITSLKTDLKSLDAFCRNEVTDTTKGSYDATAGSAIPSSYHLVNVSIPNGTEYKFKLEGNSRITKYHLYENNNAARYNCVPETEYTIKATHDVTYISVFVSDTDVTGTGEITGIVSITTPTTGSLESRIDSLEYTSLLNDSLYETNSENDWVQGYWAISDGTITNSTTWTRSNQVIDNTYESIECTDDLKMFLVAYEGSTYIGTWFGDGFVKEYDSTYVNRKIILSEWREAYPSYSFRIDVTKVGGGNLTPSDTAQKITIVKSEVKDLENAVKTVYGNFALAEYWQNGAIGPTGENPKDPATNFFYRLSTIAKLRFLVPVTIIPKAGYVFSVNQYAKDGTFEKQFSAWSNVPYTLSNAEKLYRIAIKAAPTDVLLNASDIASYIETKVLYSTPFNRILSEYANVRAVNHRGYNTESPENTLPAFALSALYGFKYVETDVLFTSDGVPVLMHDATINRTCCNASDGSAIASNVAIASITYADLIANYDACTPAQWNTWKGTKVPTFEQFIKYCKSQNFHPWIELKNEKVYTAEEVALIISLIKQAGMEEHVSFISFSYDALDLVKTQWDSVELGLNGSVADGQLLKTGKNRVFMIYAYYSDVSQAVNAGFQVCLYTVNTEAILSSVNHYAYDSILTNTLLPSQIDNVVKSNV